MTDEVDTFEEILQSRVRTKEHGEETIEVAKHEIEQIARELEFDDTLIQLAEAIYRRSLKTDFIQNRTVAQVAASSVYAASRNEGQVVRTKDVAKVASATEKGVNRTFTEQSRQLELQIGPINPKKFIPLFCSELDLSDQVIEKATEVVDHAEENDLVSGRSPAGLAAASVYACSLLCNEKRTQQEVADVANVTAATIRYRYQEQIRSMGIVD